MKTANKVELIGFIGNTPEMKTLKNGYKVAQLSIATDESYKDKTGEWVKNTTWHRVSVWNNLAEQVVTAIKKGMLVTLTGKLVNRQYTDKQGTKRSVVEIFVNTLEPQVVV